MILPKKYFNHHIGKLAGVVLALTTLYSIIVGLLFEISAIDTLANIYLQFLITFLPGLAGYALLHKKEKSWLNILALSYALGYSLNILTYFLLMPFGLGNLLKYFAILVSLLSIYILIKNPIQYPPVKLKGWSETIPVILFFLMAASDVLIYSGTNPSPLLTGSASYFRDLQYWVNTTVGVFLNFPPQAPYLDGFVLYYHYFSNIHVAFSSLVSGIDIFTLSFPLYPLTKSLLLIGGLNYLLDTFKATSWQKALLLMAIYFSTGYERISVVTNFHHFHLAPFGLDIGFAFGAFFIASFTERYRESEKKLDWPLFFETILFYAVMVGAKAPLAAMLSIFPAVICLAWLTKKNYQHAFAYGIAIAAIFLIINIFCVGTFSALNNLSDVQRMQIATMDTVLITQKFSSVFVNLVLSIGYKILASQPLLILLSAAAGFKFVTDLFKRKPKNHDIPINIALVSTAFISILFSQIVQHAGTSEMYFMMAAYLPMAALSVDALTPSRKNHFLSKMVIALSLAILAVQIYFFMFAAWGGYSAAKSLQKGFENIAGRNAPVSSDAEIPNDSIQKSDVEGLVWLRENTPKDALIATDRATLLADEFNRSDYFYYVLFAERQMVIEGTSMVYVLKGASDKIVSQRQQKITALFNNSGAALQDLKDQGVDYIVQTRWLTPQFQPGSELALVYSTDSLNIYQILSPVK